MAAEVYTILGLEVGLPTLALIFGIIFLVKWTDHRHQKRVTAYQQAVLDADSELWNCEQALVTAYASSHAMPPPEVWMSFERTYNNDLIKHRDMARLVGVLGYKHQFVGRQVFPDGTWEETYHFVVDLPRFDKAVKDRALSPR